jgi:hypothetical protein
MRPDTPLVLVKLFLVVPIVPLDGLDFRKIQTGEPADNLIVRAPRLKVRNQVVNGDPAI